MLPRRLAYANAPAHAPLIRFAPRTLSQSSCNSPRRPYHTTRRTPPDQPAAALQSPHDPDAGPSAHPPLTLHSPPKYHIPLPLCSSTLLPEDPPRPPIEHAAPFPQTRATDPRTLKFPGPRGIRSAHNRRRAPSRLPAAHAIRFPRDPQTTVCLPRNPGNLPRNLLDSMIRTTLGWLRNLALNLQHPKARSPLRHSSRLEAAGASGRVLPVPKAQPPRNA